MNIGPQNIECTIYSMYTLPTTRFAPVLTSVDLKDMSVSVLSVKQFLPTNPDTSYCLVFAQLYSVRLLVTRFIRRIKSRIQERRDNACSTIQQYWHRCISDPDYFVCRRRLLCEFDVLADSNRKSC